MSIDPKKFFKENGSHFIQTGVKPKYIKLGFTIEELYQNFEARLAAEKKGVIPNIKHSQEFDVWYDENEEWLSIEAAETGANRELDFDSETYAEFKYEEYLKGENK